MIFRSPRSYQISKASKESYSAISEQGKDEDFCSIIWMQYKSSEVQSHDRSGSLQSTTSWYYCFFAHNTDVAYTRMASSSKGQNILIKENKGIKRNLRKNRVHFQHNKKQRKQTQKGTNNALTSHYQSPLFLSISVLSKFTAPPAALLPFTAPSKITLQCKN